MPKNILISGAGIAGPILAFWLARHGAKVTIVERAPLLRTAGQTIDIRGAGLEVIRRMGLEDTVRSITTQEQGYQVCGQEESYTSRASSGYNGRSRVSF